MILLLLASLSFGQEMPSNTITETNVIENIELKNLGERVRALESGRPTVTGVPYFINGATVGANGLFLPLMTFKDGTTQNTAAASVTLVSSKTVLSINQGTTSTSWVSITGSTVTLTTGARRLLILFSGMIGNSIAPNQGMVTVTLDGGYPDAALSSTFGCATFRHAAGDESGSSFNCAIVTAPVTAGSHSVSAYLRTTAETGRLACGNDGTIFGVRCFMNVIELNISQ